MRRDFANTPFRRRLLAAASLGLCVHAASFVIDVVAPPPVIGRLQGVAASPVIVDRTGRFVRAFTTDDGRWRFRANLDETDPVFVARLVAIEDKRFWGHGGVDPLALARAFGRGAVSGHFRSGASTITMQAARLLEPRPRTLSSKIIEIFRAAELERRLSKRQILELYLTLAPYGGNIEGVRAASLLYFDKEPKRLSDAEQALLIALPQSPERRRPDRAPEAARAGRDAILGKFAAHGLIAPPRAAEAREVLIAARRAVLPHTAYHLARELAKEAQDFPYAVVPSTLDLGLQSDVERLLADAAAKTPDGAALAAIVVDAKTRGVRALVGSAGAGEMGGWIDMSTAIRSPGSTLKPFIYALALDDGLIGPATVIEDMPQSFGGYAPENFDRNFHGEIHAADALQHSLNIPAVRLLDKLGAPRLAGLIGAAGVVLKTPEKADKRPGLALALGGAGVTMRDLATLYAGLANRGAVAPLNYTMRDITGAARTSPVRLFSADAALKIGAILEDSPSLSGRAPAILSANAPAVSMKTGTSYGFRDAWAAGYGGGYVVVVWVGRPDGGVRPSQTGREAAAPVLFSIFDAIWRRDPNAGAGVRNSPDFAPTSVARLERPRRLTPPEIIFPRDGVELFLDRRAPHPVVLSARGGAGALTWYVGGDPAPTSGGAPSWTPTAPGFYDLTVVDRTGVSAHAKVRVTASE